MTDIFLSGLAIGLVIGGVLSAIYGYHKLKRIVRQELREQLPTHIITDDQEEYRASRGEESH